MFCKIQTCFFFIIIFLYICSTAVTDNVLISLHLSDDRFTCGGEERRLGWCHEWLPTSCPFESLMSQFLQETRRSLELLPDVK